MDVTNLGQTNQRLADHRMSRRRVLSTSGAGLAAFVLATTDSSAASVLNEASASHPLAAPSTGPRIATRFDLTGVAPQPLTGERRAAFEAYIAEAAYRLGVPGAAVAVVLGGEVAYLQGFGVRVADDTRPVTPDTLMMVGSVTKSVTSAMAATLVDDGWLSWDTPVVDLLPDFAVADPELTSRLNVADAFSASTGLPRRDPEIFFNFDMLAPEKLVASLATLPLTAPFGEQYQYNNQIYAVGGYAAAVAAGAAASNLYDGFVAAIQERILDPIGMNRSSFSLADVLTSDDYATGHVTNLDGQSAPFPLLVEDRFVTSVAPAGALWSSAREMARYVQTQLANGISPSGTRVVSAENLQRTRAPGVGMPPSPVLPPAFAAAAQHYGLGWQVGTYKGSALVSHSGGTFGFGSEVAYLPDADLGVVILTNGIQGAGLFVYAVQFRLFELLFGQLAEFDAVVDQLEELITSQSAALRTQIRTLDPVSVAPYLGRYTNPALGEVRLLLNEGHLIFDAGEIRSELRPRLNEAGQSTSYVFVDPPLFDLHATVTVQQDTDEHPHMAMTVEGENPEATQTYSFGYLETAGATSRSHRP